MTNTRLLAVFGARLRLGVVRDPARSRRSGLPRLGDAEGEDGGAARVLAVGRDEGEPPVVLRLSTPTGTRSAQARRPLGERREPCSISGSRRHHVHAVHEARDERLILGLVCDEAVVVVPLVLARSVLHGASGFVQDRSRWKIGSLRNIPPGESSWEMTACSTPRRLRE